MHLPPVFARVLHPDYKELEVGEDKEAGQCLPWFIYPVCSLPAALSRTQRPLKTSKSTVKK